MHLVYPNNYCHATNVCVCVCVCVCMCVCVCLCVCSCIYNMHVALIFNSVFYLRTNKFILDDQLQESPTVF